MPELPEVETIRRELDALVVGRRVASVAVAGGRPVRRQEPAEFARRLVGRRLLTARRRGKYLVVGLDAPSALVVHLRMTGRLRLVAAPAGGAPVEAHTHVRIAFDDGAELRFADQRTFGELYVAGDLDGDGLPGDVAGLGPDPLVDGIDPVRLAFEATGRRKSVKGLLLDQKVVAGIGNIYADEACFWARLRPSRPAGGLRRGEVVRLAGALGGVVEAAVAKGGSTLADARYVDLLGTPGTYQEHHAVYGRQGLPCRVCGRPIRRVRLAGRSSHFCAFCQR